MPLNLPDSQETIFQKLAADVQARLPTANPFLRNSYLRSLEVGFAGSLFEFYIQLQEAINQIFFDTAEGEFLERWAAIFGVTRNPATKAEGNITATGTATTVIPLGTIYNTQEGGEYETTAAATISATTQSVTSLERVGSTVTATFPSDHLLAPNVSVTISGAVETDYNGTFTIATTPSATTFTYTITATPSTPATGTILADSTTANVSVLSTDFGADQNAAAGVKMTLSTPIAGADNDAFVQFGEIAGGTDLESDEDLRTRFLERVQNPVSLFNVAAIIAQAKTVSGVTRVFVRNVDNLDQTISVTSINRSGSLATLVSATSHGLEDGQLMEVSGADQIEYNVEEKIIVIDSTTFAYVVLGTPATPATGTIIIDVSITSPGQVRIFFVRDNDGTGTAIIPTGTEITDVKNAILQIKPAHTSDSDVIVQAPVASLQPFVFTVLTPNTQDMQDALTLNLEQFFGEVPEVGQDILEDRYKAVISATIDSSGATVTAFTLSSPSGDITVAADELAILGTITFP